MLDLNEESNKPVIGWRWEFGDVYYRIIYKRQVANLKKIINEFKR